MATATMNRPLATTPAQLRSLGAAAEDALEFKTAADYYMQCANALELANPNSKLTQRDVAGLRSKACSMAGALYTYTKGAVTGRVFICTARGGGFNAVYNGHFVGGVRGIKTQVEAELRVRALVDAQPQLVDV